MTSYLVPARETRVEIRVVNSRFIVTAAPALTVEQARAFIERIKDEFADASHNVSAYLIGHGNAVIAHATDDGEPSGTAGRPALAVLQGSGLGDVVVVVTRYFGGTKLGTGGLVRAYGDAVREVLAVLPRAIRVAIVVVQFAVPYALFERARLLVGAHQGEVLDEAFGVEVQITAQFAETRYPAFVSTLRELSAGTVQPEVIERSEDAIVTVGKLGTEDGGGAGLEST
ncbi:MAG: IMPACT family protein [Anaerolineae bacterium]